MLEDKEQIRERENHRVFKQLLGTFIEEETKEKEELEEYAKDIKIIPKIYYDDFSKKMKVEFKIGDKQFYKIKDLPEFYTRMLNKEKYKYGAKLNLIHQKESFSEESLQILEFILKYAEIMKYTNEREESYNYYKKIYILDNIYISNMGLDDLFEAIKGENVAFCRNNVEKNINFSEEEPKIPFIIEQLENNKFMFKADLDIFSYEILQGKDYTYILFKDTLYRCSKEFETSTLKILDVLRKNYTNQIILDEQELTSFFAIIEPSIPNEIQKEKLTLEVEKRCIPKPLGIKIYLDYDKNSYITAEIKFCYEDIEFNPLSNEKVTIARNIIRENEALNQFIKTGFMLDRMNKKLILAKEDTIYNFLAYEIEDYMKKYEVLATDSFKKKEIHSFQMKNLGIRIENNLLEIDLSQIGIELTDLVEMLQKYKLKKKFYRLKDGTYMKLEDNEEITFLEELTSNMEIEPKELKGGIVKLPAYRTLYLEKMLSTLKNVKIQKDTTYKKMIEKLEDGKQSTDIINIEGLNADLRNYQKIGYQWLKTLDEYQFGGILADDMGLRENSSNISSYYVIYK